MTADGSVRQLWRLLWLARPFWGQYGRCIALAAVASLVSITVPYFSKVLIDQAHPARDVALVHAISVILLLFGVTTTVVSSIRGYLTSRLDALINASGSTLLFNHVQHLPVSTLAEYQVGDLTSRFSDLRTGFGGLSRLAETVLVSGPYLVAVPPVLVILHPTLAVLALFSFLSGIAITVSSTRAMRRRWTSSMERGAQVTSWHTEALTNIRALKALACERELLAKARQRQQAVIDAQQGAAAFQYGIGAFEGVLRVLSTGLVTWYGWILVVSDRLSLGSYIAFMAYVSYLASPLSQLIAFIASLPQSSAAISRVTQLLDAAPEADPNEAYETTATQGKKGRFRVELAEATYSYPGGQVEVVRDINFTLEPGTVTGIVGQSGSGKSTILKLLVGLCASDTGRVLLNGVDARALPLLHVRRHFAMVTQEPLTVRGSIQENVLLGTSGVTDSEYLTVLTECGLQGLVEYERDHGALRVAEQGVTLSGGQRQRLMIARALLQHRPVLLLDEATSQCDHQTERLVLDAVSRRKHDLTTLIVTHREAVAARCDQVIMVDKGIVVARGTHDVLLKSHLAYRALWGHGNVPAEGTHVRSTPEALRAPHVSVS